MANNCRKHIETILDIDGCCWKCQDILVAETQELAPLVRRQRRMAAVYGAWVVVTAGLAFVAWQAFLIYREWVIWNR